ncbi:MAG TPA: MG2 domain-containing protein [Chitinophagaceae bacterium]|nr:MG2 domain-containing protein [Chitinophagaceae bacterium]
MRFQTTLLPLLAGVIVFSACRRNSVSLTYTNAKDEVPQLGNLVFRFSGSLASDSLLNAWDSTEYVSFEPEIPGRFRWESPDELVFSPSQPLRPATRYKAKVKNAVLRHSSFNSVRKAGEIEFHTPPLSLEEARVIWIGETSGGAFPQIDLYFNYRVSPGDLEGKLRISLDGAEAKYTVISSSADNRISVRVEGLKAEDKDRSAEVTISRGLKPESGATATDEEIRASVQIPSPFVLTIQNVESEHDGLEGTVRVTTSQQVLPDNIRSYLRLDPAVNFAIEGWENGFIIRSDRFDVEKSYDINIARNLRGKIGGVLKEDYSGNIAFGELEAGISFTNSRAVYLSRNGGKNIEVQVTNVEKIRLVVSKIYENNLLLAHRYGYYPQETESRFSSYGGEDDYYQEVRESSDAAFGDVVFEKVIDTRSLPRSGAGRLLNFSQFEDRLPEFKGIYHVTIRSEKDYWVRDSRYISLSDLGLIVREGEESIFVFVNSIKTARPVDGVTVHVYGNNNQLLGAGTTEEGLARVEYARKEFSGFKPAMVIARTEDDFNYLPFYNTRVNTSRFDVGGKRNSPSGLDAFVYAERDIYRPGEKISFSVIVRDRKWEVPGEIPLKLKFLLPNGRELKEFRKTLNDHGSLEGSVDIGQAAITGSYTLEVYTSNDLLLASKSFSVEEFVPDRIRLTVRADRPFLRAGESTTLNLNAMNFFGPPASNRNVETEIQVKQKSFSAPKFSDYNFNLANQTSFFSKEMRQGKTDEDGNTSFQYTVPAHYANSGMLQASFYTTVFDETGRPVSNATSVDLVTQDVFFGIKEDWSYYYPLNQEVRIGLISVNRDGDPLNATARVEVIKHEYKTFLVRSGSYWRYESQKEDKLMIEKKMTIGKGTVFSYVPRSPGDYEVRIYKPGASSYVTRSFYSYGSWGGQASFQVNTEGNIEIVLDKKSYFTGETVKALFKTPFSGRMLVTTETDRVISHQFVDVSKRSADVDLKLTAEHLPNAYITATLIKPHDMSDIPLTVAHGFQNIRVEEKDRRIQVAITARKSVRSKTRQRVTVKAEPGSLVTLSAVDNGVLQVTDFKTPDPYQHFYQKKALQVVSYDIYPLLFAEMRARRSSTGGDQDLDLTKRVNPMPARRVRVVSYWSGMRKANGRGEAQFELDIPQFSGELRLMAVSYKGKSFGAAESTMTVADPIVISTALPRFLSPRDTVTVPVTLSNTTGQSATVNASLAVAGPIRVVGNASQGITIHPKTEGRINFRLVAQPTAATGKITVTVNGMGETFTDATEISVRPPSTLQKRSGSGSLTGGTTQTVQIQTGDFIPSTASYQLVVSRSPVAELAGHLKYLVQYPYGCTEQVISSAFPQIYYGDMADLMRLNKELGKTNANSNILEAIRKIRMRQLYNGAITLWDGEGTENWWVTAYAAHFLLEARKAGFDVEKGLLESMLSYLANRLKRRETITYYYNRNQNRKIAPKEVAYSLYVLALANRGNVPSMNYYKANQDLLALDSRYLLSAAFAVAGDRRSFAAMLPASFSGEVSVPQTGGSFYSDVRDEAVALNALIDVDPGNPQVPVMAKHVSDKLKGRDWLNTQERAFAFLALGKLARSSAQSDVTAEIKVNGKTIAKVDAGQWTGDANALKATQVEISAKGKGRMYYFWQSEGVSASGAYVEEDSYLKVRRKFYDRFGNVLGGDAFRQNDLVIIGITLEKSFSGTVENVVLTDLIPAGFEIENPRTKEIPGMDWIKDGNDPVALDVRDDRVHFFVDATAPRQAYYYAVRAVSPGQFRMGPVSADAMYQAEYHSYHGARTVRIE